MKLTFPAVMTIDAPAATVWRVIAHEFAEIGKWATAIPSSTPLDDFPAPTTAPVGGRACSAAVPGFRTVHEQFTEYDEANMRFRYRAVAGLPTLIRQAENIWSVQPLTADSTRIEICSELELNRVVGWCLGPILQWQINRIGKATLEELKYFIEEGQPHPRKVRSRRAQYQLYRQEPLD